jgi:hypothetical protein
MFFNNQEFHHRPHKNLFFFCLHVLSVAAPVFICYKTLNIALKRYEPIYLSRHVHDRQPYLHYVLLCKSGFVFYTSSLQANIRINVITATQIC